MTERAEQGPSDGHHPIVTKDFLLLSASSLFCFASLFMIGPLFPLYIEEVGGGTELQVGIIMGVFSLTSILVRPFVGRLSDARGRKLLLVVGLIALGASCPLYIASRGLVSMALVRALQGAGIACFHTLSITMVGDTAPAIRRGESMAYFMASIEAGIALGPPLGEYILDRSGFNPLFLFAGLLALVSLLLLLPVPETKMVEVGPPPSRSKGLRASSPIVLASVTIICGTLPLGTILSFLALYAENENIPRFGLYFTIFSAIVIILRVAGGKVADLANRRIVVFVSMIAVGSSMILLAFTHSFWQLCLSAIVFGLGVSYLTPGLSALIVDLVPPEDLGVAFGIFTSALEGGIFLGSIAMGVIISAWGLASGFLAAGVIAGCGAMVFVLYYGLFTDGPSGQTRINGESGPPGVPDPTGR